MDFLRRFEQDARRLLGAGKVILVDRFDYRIFRDKEDGCLKTVIEF